MKILITGNCGYIGAHLFRELMFASGVLNGCDLKANAPVDYRDWKGHEWDVVIHLAASVSVTESFDKPEEYFQNNALGLIPFIQNNKIGRFILISTGGAMYGNARLAKEQEASWGLCKSPYAQSKFLAEQIVRQAYPGSHVILRLGNVYGGRDSIRGEASVHAHFAQDNPILLYGGNQTRDFIHIDAVCRAILKAVDDPSIVGTFNIGSGEERCVGDLAKLYSAHRRVFIEQRPARSGEVDFISLDNTKAREAGLL